MERPAARVHHRVGAEALGQREPRFADVDRDHPAAGQPGHLQRVQAHAADADQRQRGARPDLRALGDRVVGRGDGVPEDAGALQGDVVRDLAQVDARRLEVLREPAVDGEAVLADLGAEGVAPHATELAAPAGDVEVHDDPVARREAAHLAADLGHLARDLVAHDQRDHAEPHPVGADLHVGAADADVAHTD